MLRAIIVYSPARKCFTGNNSFAKSFGRNLANYMTYSNLPKYPVPSLHNTVTKFMAFARPLQNDVEYSETVEVADKFLQSAKAHELQALLEKRGDEMSNWLTPWWIDETYLRKRNPLPFYSSKALLFPKFDYSNLDGQLEIAAKVIQSSLKYYLKIVKNELPQQKLDDSLLCMNQFRKIFGTTRIPVIGKDNILYGCDKKSQPKHIIILRKGHIFRLSVFDANGKALSIKQLINEMKMHVIPQSEEFNLNPIGVISSDQRDIWAGIYAKLKEKNIDEIKIIEDSLFAICLDEEMTESENDDIDNQALQCFHGGGCRNNSLNRWFDKTIQYVVGMDGYCGMTYDCTPSEVSIAATLMNFIYHEIKNNDFDHNDASGTIEPTVPIRFSISETDKDYILQSKRNIDRIASDTDIKIFTFEHFGKDLIKKYNISPNSFIQIGMEFAYYRMYGKEACISLMATLRKFQDGRMDIIRLPSLNSAMFTNQFNDPEKIDEIPPSMMASMLRVAILQHQKYSLEVMNGRGIDQHLFGLKMIAKEYGKSIPEILETKAYQKMMDFTLSTSQIKSQRVIPICGPSALDCYGICYNLQPKQVHFTICALHSCKETNSSGFAKELENALVDICAIIAKDNERGK